MLTEKLFDCNALEKFSVLCFMYVCCVLCAVQCHVPVSRQGGAARAEDTAHA